MVFLSQNLIEMLKYDNLPICPAVAVSHLTYILPSDVDSEVGSQQLVVSIVVVAQEIP